MIEKQIFWGDKNSRRWKKLRSNRRFISTGTHFRVLKCEELEFRIHKIWNLTSFYYRGSFMHWKDFFLGLEYEIEEHQDFVAIVWSVSICVMCINLCYVIGSKVAIMQRERIVVVGGHDNGLDGIASPVSAGNYWANLLKTIKISLMKS